MTVPQPISQKGWRYYLRMIFWISLPAVAMMLIGGAIFIILLSVLFDNFGLIPQDCMGQTIDVGGIIYSNDNQPIDSAMVIVHQRGANSFYLDGQEPEPIQIETDGEGRFLVQDYHIFACDTLTINVSAEGYIDKELRYPIPDYIPEYGESRRDELRELVIVLDVED